MDVAVTGASGLIGSALVPALRDAGHDVRVLVRREPSRPGEVGWDPDAGTIDTEGLVGVGAIVHLAGATIGKRWTAARKKEVLESRVRGTRLVAETAAALESRPVLVCASAIGFYGDRGDEVLTEDSSRGTGFLADVVGAWEEAAQAARDAGLRTVHLRTGIVLSTAGGALVPLLRQFRLFAGGRVGDGRQWWSWITLDDVVAGYQRALEGDLEGHVNLVAPGAVTNAAFTKALAAALGRPAVLPAPAFAIRAVLGEMGRELLLASQRVSPARLEADGLRFEHPELGAALRHVLGR
jgi:uncharacterized protein (TIGR01777 family)